MTLSDISGIAPPRPVVEIARKLEDAGFETWCVGGAVRDALLGHAHLDWDLATSAVPDQMKSLFGRGRTIPVGVEFGTVGILDRDGVMHEVTTFRRDVRTDGRHAVVEFGASLDEDLARRDFTINAIAFHPLRRELRDPFGGRADLEHRIVRAVGDPDARMREDRLRALRAIRFAGRLDCAIDDATWAAIVDSAAHLHRLSAERVKQEIEKTLEQVAEPSRAFALWQRSGASRELLPALDAAWSDESLRAVDCAARPTGARASQRRLVRLALLLAPLDAGEAGRLLATLRFSRAEQGRVSRLVGSWHRSAPRLEALLGDDASAVDDADVRRLVGAIGRLDARPLMRMASARWSARREGRDAAAAAPGARAVHGLHRRLLRVAASDPLEIGDLAVDGEDLRRAGIPPGPRLGKILHRLLEAVLEQPTRNRTEWLMSEARRRWDELDVDDRSSER